jgi:hypothetical protein
MPADALSVPPVNPYRLLRIPFGDANLLAPREWMILPPCTLGVVRSWMSLVIVPFSVPLRSSRKSPRWSSKACEPSGSSPQLTCTEFVRAKRIHLMAKAEFQAPAHRGKPQMNSEVGGHLRPPHSVLERFTYGRDRV